MPCLLVQTATDRTFGRKATGSAKSHPPNLTLPTTLAALGRDKEKAGKYFEKKTQGLSLLARNCQ